MTAVENTSGLVLHRRIGAPPARVFAAWTVPDTIRRWLAPGPCVVAEATNDPRAGGTFRIVSDAPEGARHTITGRYIEFVADRRLKMTWRYAGPIALLDGIETVLEIDLAPRGDDATDLTLTQTRLPSKAVCDAFEGDWPSCLDKLESEMSRTLQ